MAKNKPAEKEVQKKLRKEVQGAINNLDIIVANTAMKRSEHQQLLNDLALVKTELLKGA